MDRQALKAKLDELGVPADHYRLDGNCCDEALALLECGDDWLVRYDEKGANLFLKEFPTEEEACRFMLDKLLRTWNLMRQLGH